MSNQISEPKLGTKENPILIKSEEELKSLKYDMFFKSECSDCKKEIVKRFFGLKSIEISKYFLCKKCSTKKTKIEKYGSLENAYKYSQEKQKKTMLEKYGVENPGQLENHYDKCKKTMIKNFGSLEEAYKENNEKGKNTKKEKYGNENFNNREKAEKTFQEKYGNKSYLGSKDCLEKTKKVCQEKYGVENVSQLDWVQEKKEYSCFLKTGERFYARTEEGRKKFSEIGKDKKRIEKTKQTNLKKYGNEFLFGTEYFLEKSKQTWKEKYGVDNPSKSEEVKQKVKSTLIEKYGVENAYLIYGCHKPFKYFYKNIYFDSSWELAYYIYLSDNNIKFEYQPKLNLKYLDKNGIEHNYFPDFKIGDKIIEIKGEQFFNKNNEPFDYYTNEFWWEKYNFIQQNNIKILRYNDIVPILNYIYNKYGRNYLKHFKS